MQNFFHVPTVLVAIAAAVSARPNGSRKSSAASHRSRRPDAGYPLPGERRGRSWRGARGLACLLLAAAVPARGGVQQLAAPGGIDITPQINSAGQAAWWKNGFSLWDGRRLRLVSDAGHPLAGGWQLGEGGQIVWAGQNGSRVDIYLWDGTTVQQLSQTAQKNVNPQMNLAGQVIWEGDLQVYLWDGVRVRQLSQDITGRSSARLNRAGQVVWSDNGQIDLWDGAAVRQLTHAPTGHTTWNVEPDINGPGEVVWSGGFDRQYYNIFFWDGTTAWRLTQRTVAAGYPRINDAGQVVWTSGGDPELGVPLYLWDGTRIRQLGTLGRSLNWWTDYQINNRGEVVWNGQLPNNGFRTPFLWDGATARPLSNQSIIDPNSQLNDAGQVAWEALDDQIAEIYFWDGHSIRQITDAKATGDRPSESSGALRMNGAGQIVWSTESGAVYLYTPPRPGSLEIEPAEILEGRTALGTVILPRPAPPGGAVIALASDNPGVTVPPSITVPAGATTANFPVTTPVLSAATTATITASTGGDRWTAMLRAVLPSVASLTIDIPSLPGGFSSPAHVTLDRAAPAGGAIVALSSDQPTAAEVPATVMVRAGDGTAFFTVQTHHVTAASDVTLSAAYAGSVRTARLRVQPPALTSVSLPPGPITGGQAVQAAITLDQPASPAGLTVSLASDLPEVATVPTSIQVKPGESEMGFTIETHPVPRPVTVTITASAGGVTRTASFLVVTYGLTTLEVEPVTVTGGAPVTATATLSAPAPASGASLLLTASDISRVWGLPPTITIPAGAATVHFPVPTTPTSAPEKVTLSATLGGATRTATLQVVPPGLVSLSLDPAAVTGGSSVTGTVRLSGEAPPDVQQPITGTVVMLSSSEPAAASVPARVIVPYATATTTFSIQTHPVTVPTTVTFTANYRGRSETATLTIRP